MPHHYQIISKNPVTQTNLIQFYILSWMSISYISCAVTLYFLYACCPLRQVRRTLT